MTVRILQGDCREALRTLHDESVHCVVTSPPYWGLRDYGIDGQLGMESSLGEYVETMVEVFREVRRVLRKDGTLWLNLGDSYAASVNGRSAADTKALGEDDRTFRDKPFSTIGPVYVAENRKSRVGQSGNKNNRGSDFDGRICGFRPGSGRADGIVDERGQHNRNGLAGYDTGFLKPKDLCGIPWRVAFALQDDGWWLRSDIVWSKANPMPESVTDRPTRAHEYLFLLTKSERYFYDAEAIKEPMKEVSLQRLSQPNVFNQPGGPKDSKEGNRSHRKALNNQAERLVRHEKWKTRFEGWDEYDKPLGRNKRSVWEIATAPFPEAHFATFPSALVEPCIKAGTSENGCCAKCGAPWRRILEKQANGKVRERSSGGLGTAIRREPLGLSAVEGTFQEGVSYKTMGWSPSCSCEADIVRCVVLDPFGGAGTTGLVADRLGRDAILIELNPTYIEIARRRIHDDAPLFSPLEAMP